MAGSSKSKRTFGFGIVGAGSIAVAHIDSIMSLSNAKLVGITSRSELKAETLARRYGAKCYSGLENMLDDNEVDVVCVCTPSGLHRDVAIAAAVAGRHVIVEKPLEISVERAIEICIAADASGVKLATIFNNRFSDASIRLKEAVTSGEIGKPIQADAQLKWFRPQKYYDSAAWRGTWALDGGGALMNQGIHQVDLLFWIVGRVYEVFAFADTLNHTGVEVEDTLVAVLRFENGALGSVAAATSLYPGEPKNMYVHGTNGSIQLRNNGIASWRIVGLTDEEQNKVVASFPEDRSENFAKPMAKSFEGHRRQIADFLFAIENDTKPAIDGWEGLRSLEIVTAIYRSVKLGVPVKVGHQDHCV